MAYDARRTAIVHKTVQILQQKNSDVVLREIETVRGKTIRARLLHIVNVTETLDEIVVTYRDNGEHHVTAFKL